MLHRIGNIPCGFSRKFFPADFTMREGARRDAVRQ
jgi:hypothetical protein